MEKAAHKQDKEKNHQPSTSTTWLKKKPTTPVLSPTQSLKQHPSIAPGCGEDLFELQKSDPNTMELRSLTSLWQAQSLLVLQPKDPIKLQCEHWCAVQLELYGTLVSC